ncbi:MAG: hypothetical protein WC935_08595 [Thermoleophilia bacterium]
MLLRFPTSLLTAITATALLIAGTPLALAAPGDQVGFCQTPARVCVEDSAEDAPSCDVGGRTARTALEVGAEQSIPVGPTHVYYKVPVASAWHEEDCSSPAAPSQRFFSWYGVGFGGRGSFAVGSEGFWFEIPGGELFYWETLHERHSDGTWSNTTTFDGVTYETNYSDGTRPTCRPSCPFTMPPPPQREAGNMASCGHDRDSASIETLSCFANQEGQFYWTTMPGYTQKNVIDHFTRPLSVCPLGTPCHTFDPPSPQVFP